MTGIESSGERGTEGEMPWGICDVVLTEREFVRWLLGLPWIF